MTKRALDKKIAKISFLESSNDHEEHFLSDWRLDCSSDDDDDEYFLKNKSEVLWSRDNDGFFEKGFCHGDFDSFSDMTGRTVSSCSWHNDDFDVKSMNKVRLSLEAIDDALYEKKKSACISDEVFQECCDWSERFPFLRLKGQQIIKTGEKDESSPLQNSNPYYSEDPSSNLQVEGRKVVFHAQDRSFKQPYPENTVEDFEVPNFLEEIIDVDCDFEEYLGTDSKDICDNILQSTVSLNESALTSSSIKVIQEKIIDRLTLEMWPNVLTILQKLDMNRNNPSDFQLPPIATAKDRQKPVCLQRPKTEGMSLSTLEFPKLDDILSVSPKILQKKGAGLGGFVKVARPTSEMSLFSRNHAVSHFSNFKAAKSIFHQSNINIYGKLKNPRIIDKESENCSVFLPALEEDIQDSSDVLRGFHIKPETKEITNRTQLSSRNGSEASSSQKHDCFLPPIEDKDNLPTNIKLTRNLFTFYGSQLKNEKRRCTKTAVSKQDTNSIRQQSASRKSAKSHNFMQPKSVNDEYGINKNNIKSQNQSMINSTHASMENDDDATNEKSITLFPIVTSLVPYKEKNYPTVKKGLLHAFVGRKR